MLKNVQAAFLLLGAGPAAGAFVAIRFRSSRTWSATDARVTRIVQRVVRHAILINEVPYVLDGPLQDGVDFDQFEFRVPLNGVGLRTIFGLISTNGTYPGLRTGYRRS